MELQQQLNLLKQELNIPGDKFNLILYSISRNFIKKYESTSVLSIPNKNINFPTLHGDNSAHNLLPDLKNTMKQLDIYTQYTLDILAKYPLMNRLEHLVKGIIDNQAQLLNYLVHQIVCVLEDREKHEKNIIQLTSRVYQKCVSCERQLNLGKIENVQDEIQLRFKDPYEYFMRDLDEINRLEQEAMLILQKKNLGIEGICEQVYIQKLEKVQDNMANSIQYITSSLDNIIKFQQKIAEMQEHQYFNQKSYYSAVGAASNSDSLNASAPFNPKNYVIQYSEHFRKMIDRLSQKLDSIRKYTKTVYDISVQTKQAYTDIQNTQVKLKKAMEDVTSLSIQNKKYDIQKNSLQMQLNELRGKYRISDEQKSGLERDIEKYQHRLKGLELEVATFNRRDQIARIVQMNEKTSGSSGRDYLGSAFSYNLDYDKKSSKKSTVIQEESEDSIDNDEVPQEVGGGKNDQNLLHANMRKISKVMDVARQFKKLAIRQSFVQALLPKNMPARNLSNMSSDSKKFKPKLQSENEAVPEILKKSNKVYSKQIKKSYSSQQALYQNAQSIRLQKIRQLGIHHTMNLLLSQAVSNSLNSMRNNSISSSLEHIYSNFLVCGKSLPQILGYGSFQQEMNRFLNGFSGWEQAMVPNMQEVDIEGRNKLELLDKIKKLKKKPNQSLKGRDKMLQTNSFSVKKSHINKIQDSSHANISYNNTPAREPIVPPQNKTTALLKKIKTQFNQNQVEGGEAGMGKKQNKKENVKLPMAFKTKNHLAMRSSNSDLRYSQVLDNAHTSIASRNTMMVFPKFNFLQNNTNELASTAVNGFNGLGTLQTLNLQRYMSEQLVMIEQKQVSPSQFTQDDLKMLYYSLQEAYQFNKKGHQGNGNPNHRKSQSCLVVQDILTHQEIKYMKYFFNVIAEVHLSNCAAYQKIKMFMISPYQSVVAKLSTDFRVAKSTGYSLQMKEALFRIILLHRKCTVKGEICKHLQYFIKKINKINSHT